MMDHYGLTMIIFILVKVDLIFNKNSFFPTLLQEINEIAINKKTIIFFILYSLNLDFAKVSKIK